MSLNREFFFDHVRKGLFGGSIKQAQVSNLEAILDYWETNNAGKDDRWLAYALATAFHETDRTFGPISEYGLGKGKKYGVPDPLTHQVYYGRGLVQLTWRGNYDQFGRKLGIDLLNKPELALELDNAIPIMFIGMEQGSFTKKKLSDYFDRTHQDWTGARRIINGLDQAEKIGGYGETFYAALSYTV